MADPVGLAASVITIAALAYDSSKKLFELINAFQDISPALSDLCVDLETVQRLLQSLEDALKGTNDAILSDGLKKCLEDLKPSMEACSKACGEFVAKLEEKTSHSTKDRVSRRDKVRLLFEEKSIAAFKCRLGSHKLTINIAL
ncbi:hypothetical protein B0O99DRAFT_464348, partial [Bisporella sp. PMI_857]